MAIWAQKYKSLTWLYRLSYRVVLIEKGWSEKWVVQVPKVHIYRANVVSQQKSWQVVYQSYEYGVFQVSEVVKIVDCLWTRQKRPYNVAVVVQASINIDKMVCLYLLYHDLSIEMYSIFNLLIIVSLHLVSHNIEDIQKKLSGFSIQLPLRIFRKKIKKMKR